MRLRHARMLVLSTLVLIGCPSEFGKDGRIAKAVHKDVQENLIIVRCSEEWKRKVCDGHPRNERECLKCGG